MSVALKYAVVERERRYAVASLPDCVISTREIVDRWLDVVIDVTNDEAWTGGELAR